MTVAELREVLEDLPDHLEIRMLLDCDIDHDTHTIEDAVRRQSASDHYLLLEG